MTPDQIKKKVLQFKDWEYWADRPFGAFILSLFKDGETREYMRKVGVDVEWPSMLFQKGAWYRSDKVWDLFEKQLLRYLKKGGSVFKVVKSCNRFEHGAKKEIKKLILQKKDPIKKLKKLCVILSTDITFVWLTHGLEYIYKKRLYKEVPKYYSADVDKFIGDATYPKKKNQHVFLEQALRSKQKLETIREKFGWIKARDGFSDIFSIKELSEERERLKKIKPVKYIWPKVPKQLKNLIAIGQELVFLRTYRTDVLYEIMYLARPILNEVADYYNIPYKSLRDYSIHDLIKGKLKKYTYGQVCAISVGKEFALFNNPILNDQYSQVNELKGMVAYKGMVRGKVKIVRTAYEIDKVKNGDILIAPTTAPSFIMGMKRAAAFVTDEGGITSHSAIVSREIKKPCIIGTKIATKVFKDGDLVEVDANRGVVKKITK